MQSTPRLSIQEKGVRLLKWNGMSQMMVWHTATECPADGLCLNDSEGGEKLVCISGLHYTTFLTSQSDPMIGWKRTKPSYEEYYVVDAPMNRKSEYGRGYTFPALFKTPDENWVLLTETGVDGYYCASHLSDFKDGRYTVAFPMQEENNGNGCAERVCLFPAIHLGELWQSATILLRLLKRLCHGISLSLVMPLRVRLALQKARGAGFFGKTIASTMKTGEIYRFCRRDGI